MARSEARLLFSIWEGLEGVSAHAKLVYCVLLTEKTVNHAGVGNGVRIERWAKKSGLTVDQVEKALIELGQEPHVVLDRHTDEILIRTLIRNDRVFEQPYVLKGALKEAAQTESKTLRWWLAVELRKLPPRRPDGVSKTGRPVVYPDPHAAADALDPGVPPPPGKGSRDPSETLSNGSVENPSETLFEGSGDPPAPKGSQKGLETLRGRGGGRGGGEVVTSVDGCLPSSASADEGFDEFWQAYPRKVEKRDALKAWRQMRREKIPAERLITGARGYAEYLRAEGRPKDKIKHPASWLRAGGYDDHQPTLRLVPAGRSVEDISDDEIDVEAILGPDHWTPDPPPRVEGLPREQRQAWFRTARNDHQAARLREARAVLARRQAAHRGSA